MIAAVIPTRFRPPQVGPLLELLAADGVEAIVLDSADYGHRIYRMWNEGVRLAKAAGAERIAILNDDIATLPGTLPLMAECLADRRVGAVYPDVRAPMTSLPARPLVLEATSGTWGAGGMTGFCFMFRGDPSVPYFNIFDESYHWWYGDDDFEERVRTYGRDVCRIVGLPIVHAADGSAGRVMDEISPLVAVDQALWEARHAA